MEIQLGKKLSLSRSLSPLSYVSYHYHSSLIYACTYNRLTIKQTLVFLLSERGIVTDFQDNIYFPFCSLFV